MDVGHFFSLAAESYFLVTSLTLALTAARARAEEDEELPSRLFRTTQRLALFGGLPALLGCLWWLFSQRQGHGDSGIMSGETAFVLLFILGALGLLLVWVCTVALAFIAAALVRHARPVPAGLITFFFVQFAPAMGLLLFVLQRPVR